MTTLVHVSFRVPRELKVKLDTTCAITQRKSYEVYGQWVRDFLSKQKRLKNGTWKIPILRRPKAVPVAYVGAELPPDIANSLKRLAVETGRTQNALFITALTIAKDVSTKTATGRKTRTLRTVNNHRR